MMRFERLKDRGNRVLRRVTLLAAGIAVALSVTPSAEAAPAPAHPVAVAAATPEAMPTPQPQQVPHLDVHAIPSSATFFSPMASQTSESVTTEVPYTETFTAVVPSDSTNAVVRQIEQTQASIWPTTVARVDVQGYASNEANYNTPDAGLGFSNPANVILATNRGAEYAQQLERSPTLQGVPVHVLKGVEEVLTPSQIKSLRTVAAKRGMTLKQMVATYDAGSGDAAMRHALDFFQKDRAVEVTMTIERYIPPTFGRRSLRRLESQNENATLQQPSGPQSPGEQAPTHLGTGSTIQTALLGGGLALALTLTRGGEQQPMPSPAREAAEVEVLAEARDERELVGARS